ncbi:MAG: hypothetical protein NUV46_03450 [Nanoarchaeota archaeon]|nr:hypothetical protein [Nanoarchaeota archaeon]
MKTVLWGYGKTGRAIYRELKKDPKNNIKIIRKNTLFKKNKLLNNDLVIISFGNPSKILGKNFKSTYESRIYETEYNKQIFEESLPLLKLIKSPIIVVTNQPDIWVMYLKSNLNKENIFSFGTSLDREEFSNLVGRKIEGVGPHGLVIPLLNSKHKKDYFDLINKSEKILLQKFKSNNLNYTQMGINFAKNYKEILKKKKPFKLNNIEKDLIKKSLLRIERDYKRIFKK